MIQREIELTCFEVAKVIYLRECSTDFFENYKHIIPFIERLAIRYYVLRAFLFYSDALLGSLEAKQIPSEIVHYKLERWREFTDSK